MENTIKRTIKLLSIDMMNLEMNKQDKFTAWTHMLHTVDSQCILKTGLSV